MNIPKGPILASEPRGSALVVAFLQTGPIDLKIVGAAAKPDG